MTINILIAEMLSKSNIIPNFCSIFTDQTNSKPNLKVLYMCWMNPDKYGT